jgi:uncharacterized protein YecT (DUF1311 family)
MERQKSIDAYNALVQKYPNGVSDITILTEEQKAWIQMKIQALADVNQKKQLAEKLNNIQNNLIHATDDIPDSELQNIVSFVFENMDEIGKLLGVHTSENE